MKLKKIAIIYDWIDSWGGAERVLEVFAGIFPTADWFTLIYDKKGAKWARELDIQTSFINKLPRLVKKNRLLTLPLMPFAVESINLSEYTHVLSITSAFSKAVITRPETIHVSYILSPPRFLWSHQNEYGTGLPFMRPYINYLRNWDYIAARRADKLVAISPEVAARIKKYYNLEADVITPPFDATYWMDMIDRKVVQNEKKDYLVVSRLVPYKRVDLVVDAFNAMPSRQLTIVGDGPLRKRLHRMAKNNTTFLHNVTDSHLAKLYNTSKALIMPQREDFGYTALEAQACGCPVITYKRGGIQSTVVNDETGIYFESQTPEVLQKALESFEEKEYALRRSLDKTAKEHLAQFSTEVFTKKFTTLLQ